ncbi:signal peptidase II [Shimazuella sp. AN120528]|nr:signal peptidase II [Shimazuella soli]MCH5584736.1 signal peptidase II [Shimazuella soli]
MERGSLVLLFFIISILVIALDQVSKWWIVQHMELYQSISVVPDFFYITSHRNRGAAFGILQEQRWLFIIVTIGVVIAIIVYMVRMKKESILTKTALSFVLGGAVGNLIDRIRTGEVVDFFHFQFGSYHFPIFNVADSSICVGVVLFLIANLMDYKKEQYDTSVGDA